MKSFRDELVLLVNQHSLENQCGKSDLEIADFLVSKYIILCNARKGNPMIDIRTVKCSCGQPDCKVGISFDENQDGKTLLRFNDKYNEECGMVLDESTIRQLISELQGFLPDNEQPLLSPKACGYDLTGNGTTDPYFMQFNSTAPVPMQIIKKGLLKSLLERFISLFK